MTEHAPDGNAVPHTIRPYLPEDRPGVIRVIESVYREYNYVMGLDEFDRDLVDIPSTYQDSGGEFWVLESGGAVAGTTAVLARDAETCELKRLYLLKSFRRRGLGRTLAGTVIDWAREHGFRRIVLWSDTLFEPAHMLYVKCGFTPTGKTRSIDPLNPTCVERFFVKENLREE